MAFIKNTNTDKPVFTLYLDENTIPHIKKGNKKLGKNIYHIDLLPFNDIISYKGNGRPLCNVVGSCGKYCAVCKEKCYAANYIRRFANTCIPAYGENTLLARKNIAKYFAEIDNFISTKKVKIFRWHVSGEILSEAYYVNMRNLAIKHPEINFYVYTKAFDIIEKYNTEIENFHLLVSQWHKCYKNPMGYAEFIYDDGTEPELETVFHCPAVRKDGTETGITCEQCGRCPNAKRGDKIAVYAH